MPPGLLASLYEMTIRVARENYIQMRTEEFEEGKIPRHLKKRDPKKLIQPLNVSDLIFRLMPATPLVRIQEEHPARAQISILDAELYEIAMDLQFATPGPKLDPVLLDRVKLRKAKEDLEEDIEAWEVSRRRIKYNRQFRHGAHAGARFLVIRKVVILEDSAISTADPKYKLARDSMRIEEISDSEEEKLIEKGNKGKTHNSNVVGNETDEDDVEDGMNTDDESTVEDGMDTDDESTVEDGMDTDGEATGDDNDTNGNDETLGDDSGTDCEVEMQEGDEEV